MKDQQADQQTITIRADARSLRALHRAMMTDPARRAAWERVRDRLFAPLPCEQATDENNMIEPPQPSGDN